MNKSVAYIYEFGEFRLDLLRRELRRAGELVAMTPKVFDTLRVLVTNQGKVVTKDALMDEIWADSFVEESGLMRNISILRKTLGDSVNSIPFIVTVPGQGYRFLAEAREIPDEDDDALIVREQIRARITVEETESKTEIQTLAVLPFRTIGDRSEDNAYLGLGMADALITKLSNIKQLRVRPTSAVVKYSDAAPDPLQAGRDLRVESVIEGSIWQISERLRVTVQLVGVKDEAALWAEKFDESFTDIFAIQDSISERVAAALEFQLTSSEQRRLAKRETENTTAYQFLMRGFYYMNQFAPQSLAEAISNLEKAVEIDPDYALAHAYLAGCHILLTTLGAASPAEVAAKARAFAARSLALDKTLPSAHYAQAFVYFLYDWDLKNAEKAFRRAIELNPNDALANKHYSIYLFSAGRFDEALAQAEIAYHLDPLTPGNTAHLGLVHYGAKQFDRALFWYRKALEISPHFLNSQIGLALTFAQKEMFTEALSTLDGIDESLRSEPNFITASGYVSAVAGETEKARRCLAALLKLANERFVSAYDIAALHAGLGETENSIEWLEKAVAERAVALRYLKVDPRFDALHKDSRFESLIDRLGFRSQ